MGTLDKLLRLDGVVCAGEFTLDGEVVAWEANMDEVPDDWERYLEKLMSTQMAETTAKFCAAVTVMFNQRAKAYVRLSDLRWLPQRFWTYCGGDWTVAVGHSRGVFAETARVDFNQLYRALADD